MNTPQQFHGTQQPQPGAMPPQQSPYPGAQPGQAQQPGPTPATPRQSGRSPATTILGTAALLVSGLIVVLTLLYSKNEIAWFVESGILLALGIMLLTRTHLAKGIAVSGMAVSVIAVCLRVFEYGISVYGWRTPLDVGYIMETTDGIMFYCSILVTMLVFLPSVLHSLRRKPVQQPPRQQYYYGTPNGY